MLTPVGLRTLESAAIASGVTLGTLDGLSFEDRTISILKSWVESTGGTMPSGSFNNRVLTALETIAAGGGGGGGNTNGYGLWSARPASPAAAGDTWRCSDGPVSSVGVGGAWVNRIDPAGEITVVETTDWTAGGGAVWADTTGVGIFTVDGYAYAAHTSGDIHTFGVIRPPTTDAGALNQLQLVFGSATDQGLSLFTSPDATQLRVVSWVNWKTQTTPGFPYTLASFYAGAMGYGNIAWFQLEDDGTNLIFRGATSPNGPWTKIFSRGRTADLTGGPTEIGLWLTGLGVEIVHYAKT